METPWSESQDAQSSTGQMNVRRQVLAVSSPPTQVEGVCFRYGASGHLLKNRHSPYTPVLDFARNRSGDAKHNKSIDTFAQDTEASPTHPPTVIPAETTKPH